MTGCCDLCEKADFLYPFKAKGWKTIVTLYLCHKCLYELRTDRDRCLDEFDTNDGTLDSAEPGGVRDGI
jgi:hypothetical protein